MFVYSMDDVIGQINISDVLTIDEIWQNYMVLGDLNTAFLLTRNVVIKVSHCQGGMQRIHSSNLPATLVASFPNTACKGQETL